MNKLSLSALAVAAVFAVTGAAQSAALTLFTQDFGTAASGSRINDLNGPDGHLGANVFVHTFDLATAPWRIEGVKLSVTYKDVNPTPANELWQVNGSTLAGMAPIGNLTGNLGDWQTQEFTLAGSVLESVISTKSLSVWFKELSTFHDNFALRNLTVQISSVPVPAAGLLMVGALGGLGLLRRRKDKAAA